MEGEATTSAGPSAKTSRRGAEERCGRRAAAEQALPGRPRPAAGGMSASRGAGRALAALLLAASALSAVLLAPGGSQVPGECAGARARGRGGTQTRPRGPGRPRKSQAGCGLALFGFLLRNRMALGPLLFTVAK
jgi:hypothetical protein